MPPHIAASHPLLDLSFTTLWIVGFVLSIWLVLPYSGQEFEPQKVRALSRAA